MVFIKRIVVSFFYSFPIQLVLNNLKRNQVLVLCWVLLLAMVTGSVGRYLGIPYLFLDPEYLNKVNYLSFFIVGAALAGFTMAFHITCYIMDGYRFSFVGALSKPFTKFAINNSLLPVLFMVVYLYEAITFQLESQYASKIQVIYNVGGFATGYLLMGTVFFLYSWFTNKDIFKYVVCRIDEKLKQNVQATRASALKKLDVARKKQERVDNYLDYNLRFKKVDENPFYDKSTVLQVFDQNHFNLVIIQVLIFVLVLVLGVFKDYELFQLPVSASVLIFLTIFVMVAGAFSYWFGGWAVTAGIILFVIVNELTGEDFFNKKYPAFGLDYTTAPAHYTIDRLRTLNDSAHIADDKQQTLTALENWAKKFEASKRKPKMVFVCASGGGKRAAVWALNVLQYADSVTNGNMMKHTMLITGASGGLIGTGYFRELKLRKQNGEKINPYKKEHLQKISTDNLNPLIFSLLANDLFVGFTKFEYAGQHYVRDRGYTFEQQLNHITEYLMDKPVKGYARAEQQSLIPMMILSPTVVNDGRKIYISALPVSYMNSDLSAMQPYQNTKISGVDFGHLFKEQQGDSLSFLSALRMSATFPYITPNTTLPTNPPIEIMDAGISDNFGITDAVRFLYAFREWIDENTSGVVFVSVRDSPKLPNVIERKGQTILSNFSQPISSVYNNFENFQDITSDNLIGCAQSWFKAPIHRIDIQYEAQTDDETIYKTDSIHQSNIRASLSWRLTDREKTGVINNINTEKNKRAVMQLKELLD